MFSNQEQSGNCEENYRILKLYADNCAGQNENWFVLCYFAWRILLGLEDDVKVFFLVASHTEKVCDGAFGDVERKQLIRDVNTPADMMSVVE